MWRGLYLTLMIYLASTLSINAEEVITDFHVDIEIAKNGEMLVTETITVVAEGRKIRRGIYRDFPRHYLVEDGTLERVKFDIVSVRRNGQEEPYHSQVVDDYRRVFFGEEDVFINYGPHTYELTYETDRQIFFNDEDEELYWNVTGNGWAFTIEKASATVTLKDGGTFKRADLFTGRQGDDGKDGIAELAEDNTKATFSTTAPLSPGEGLTVVAYMPYGTIDEPTEEQMFWWFMRDFGHSVMAALTCAIVGLYYLIAWVFIGRDPDLGAVRERQTTTLGISPALAHYIHRKSSFDGNHTAFSAAILNLAVKGYILIKDFSGDPELVVDENKAYEKLPVGEAAIMDKFKEEGHFRIGKSNGKSLASMRTAFQNAIEDENRGIFYEKNRGWVIAGLVLSALGLAVGLYFNFNGIFSLILGIIFGVIGGAIFIPLYFLMKRFLRIEAPLLRVLLVLILGAVIAAGISFSVLVLYLAVDDSHTWGHVPFIIATIALIGLNILFYDLMGRPTGMGAELMAQIEGLKKHLENYHQQRLNLSGTPDMSPKYYEKQLPYAVALGLEEPWTKAFDEWLSSAEAVRAGVKEYDPYWDRDRWYRDRRTRRRMGGAAGFAGAMSSSVASAMPKPKSSSGSGGSSGGGGGGGGGGGW